MLRPALARLFVRKGLCRDVETASTVIEVRFSEITSERILTLTDLIRCFAPKIFQESLVVCIKKINSQSDKELSLDLKVSNYKRKLKM